MAASVEQRVACGRRSGESSAADGGRHGGPRRATPVLRRGPEPRPACPACLSTSSGQEVPDPHQGRTSQVCDLRKRPGDMAVAVGFELPQAGEPSLSAQVADSPVFPQVRATFLPPVASETIAGNRRLPEFL